MINIIKRFSRSLSFTTNPTMSASIKSLIDLTKARRTIYELKPELPTGVTEQEITALASAIIKHTPTSFNIQNIRAIVLYGDANKKLWSSVYEATKEFPFSGRPKSLAETSYGTIVFFNDQTTIDEISKKFEVYKDNFPIWAANANGAAQIDIWKAISAMGLGANLQHFNPWVQESVKDKVDGSWNVVAQLAFGVPAGEAGEKQFADYEIKEFR